MLADLIGQAQETLRSLMGKALCPSPHLRQNTLQYCGMMLACMMLA
jgi:hypothetical protein